MRLLIEMEMPAPGTERSPASRPVSIEERVRDALECIESGRNSTVEWLMVNKLYARLQKMRRTPRITNLMRLIEPVLARYGYHRVSSEK